MGWQLELWAGAPLPLSKEAESRWEGLVHHGRCRSFSGSGGARRLGIRVAAAQAQGAQEAVGLLSEAAHYLLRNYLLLAQKLLTTAQKLLTTYYGNVGLLSEAIGLLATTSCF